MNFSLLKQIVAWPDRWQTNSKQMKITILPQPTAHHNSPPVARRDGYDLVFYVVASMIQHFVYLCRCLPSQA